MGTAQETTEEGCLLACSLWRGWFALLDTQDHLGTTQSGPGPVTPIISEENAPQPCQTQSYTGIFSLESPSSQMVPACVELTGK